MFVRDDSRLPRSPSLEDESGVLLPRPPSPPSDGVGRCSSTAQVLKEELSNAQSRNHELAGKLAALNHPPSPFPFKTTTSKVQEMRLELERVQSRNRELSKRITATKSRLSASNANNVATKD